MVGKTSVGGEKSVVGDLFCGCAGQLSWELELKVWEGSGGARSAYCNEAYSWLDFKGTIFDFKNLSRGLSFHFFNTLLFRKILVTS